MPLPFPIESREDGILAAADQDTVSRLVTAVTQAHIVNGNFTVGVELSKRSGRARRVIKTPATVEVIIIGVITNTAAWSEDLQAVLLEYHKWDKETPRAACGICSVTSTPADTTTNRTVERRRRRLLLSEDAAVGGAVVEDTPPPPFRMGSCDTARQFLQEQPADLYTGEECAGSCAKSPRCAAYSKKEKDGACVHYMWDATMGHAAVNYFSGVTNTINSQPTMDVQPTAGPDDCQYKLDFAVSETNFGATYGSACRDSLHSRCRVVQVFSIVGVVSAAAAGAAIGVAFFASAAVVARFAVVDAKLSTVLGTAAQAVAILFLIGAAVMESMAGSVSDDAACGIGADERHAPYYLEWMNFVAAQLLAAGCFYATFEARKADSSGTYASLLM